MKYPTDSERLEARRKSWREYKRRKDTATKEARHARKAYIDALLDQTLAAHAGPPERRQMIIDILDRGIAV